MKKIILVLAFAITNFVNAQTTQLSTPFCGYTATSTTEFIWADSLGTPSVSNNDRYRFMLVNGSNTYTWQTNNEWPIMQFYLIAGIVPGTTYTTSVAWSSDFGATFGPYGSTCLLTSPSTPTTQLTSGSCGSSPALYSTLIYANYVPNATQYEYRLINAALGYTQTLVKSNNNFILSQFTGLTNNTTYTVDVRLTVNSIVGSYGTACSITTPAGPTTQLSAGSCNSSPASYNTLLFADLVGGASQYQFQITNVALGYSQTLTKSNNNFVLSQFSGLTNNTTYSVAVRVFFNSAWQSYGNLCNVTTPSAPTTSLQASECGVTASSYTSQLFHAVAVSGATHYKFKLENMALGYSQEYEKNNNNFILNQFTGLTNNTTYTCSVKVEYNGSYGSYGASCDITTPSSFMRLAYPNPFTETTELNFETDKPITINVYDRYGKNIDIIEMYNTKTILLGGGYPTGIYNVIVTHCNEIKSFKLVKN